MSGDLDERMAALGARFQARASNSAVDLRAAGMAGDLPHIVRLSHILAGSAGLFGFPQVGAAASEVELAAESGDREALDRLLPALTRLLDEAAQGR